MHDVFYFTDIHGHIHMYNYIINWCYKQDPECTIIFGGDAADRGDEGYQIIKNLLSNPNVIYLKGNHESIFTGAAYEILNAYADTAEKYYYIHNIKNTSDAADVIYDLQWQNKYLNLHCINGGTMTLINWLLDGAPIDIIEQIDNLPITFSYNDMDFCHAGGDPRVFKLVSNAEAENKIPDPNNVEMCLWDREHYNLGWFKDRICIHGHTPTIILPSQIYNGQRDKKTIHPISWRGDSIKNSINGYNGIKIDMDTAIAFTGRAYVLNILTKQVYGFQDSNIDNIKNISHDIKLIEKYKIID